MIEVSHLTKRFGRTVAINDISFSAERGEIIGFLGPNGAGKTTTMRILSCYLTATGGDVRIAGYDVFSDSIEVRKKIGYMPENVPLYQDMRVIEYLLYRGRLKGLYGRKLHGRVEDVSSKCGLTGVMRKLTGHLSKGYRQRVGLADVLLHEPDLLILDEPTIGLDPIQIRQIRHLVKNLSERRTVLLSSHILSEVEMICDRVLIMDNGSIVASDSPQKLVGLIKGNIQVVLEVKGERRDVLDALEGIKGVEKVIWEASGDWNRFTCECDRDSDVREKIFKVVAGKGWSLRELRMEKRNLEDVFVSITMENGSKDTKDTPETDGPEEKVE